MVSQGSGSVRVIYVCDTCRVQLAHVLYAPLPAPWRAVSVPGWVGQFHACSDPCELTVRETRKNGRAPD